MGSERKRSIVAIDAEDDDGHAQAERQTAIAVRTKVTPKPRKLPILLPKSKEKAESKPKEPTATRRPGPCGIRACERLACNLVSHRHYARTYGIHALKKRNTSSTEGSGERLGAASRSGTTTPQLQRTIAKSAGFPVLPLNAADGSDPTLQYLFHEFFNHQLDGLLKLIVPPFSGYEAWAKKRHQDLFGMGVQTELDCLNFVGAAYIYILGHAQVPKVQSTETAIMVHSHILKGLRAILGDFEPARDTDRVLSIMYTLVMFGLLEPDKSATAHALLGHQKAMIRVTNSLGGLHNCGPNMSLAVSLDRLIATVTETDPVYSSWENVKLPMQRAPKYPTLYGNSFTTDEMKGILPNDVLVHCLETCRAIEILEGEKWSFSVEPGDPSGEIYYLYYLRDRISDQFVFLNARMAREGGRAKCVLLATRLVEYAVLWNNYNTMLPFMIADRLLNLLSKQDLPKAWKGLEDVLKWILFGLTCVSRHWQGRALALNLCRKTFDVLYNGNWPENWRNEQRALLRRFVWSSRLDEAFLNACDELRSGILPSN